MVTPRDEYCRRCFALLQAVIIWIALLLLSVHVRTWIGDGHGPRFVSNVLSLLGLLLGLQSVIVYVRWGELKCP